MNLLKTKLSAGGYRLSITRGKGNTKYGKKKKEVIIWALEDSYVEGVYITKTGKIKRQLLNGHASFLDSKNSF